MIIHDDFSNNNYYLYNYEEYAFKQTNNNFFFSYIDIYIIEKYNPCSPP